MISSVDWQKTQPAELNRNAVHIWRIALPDFLSHLDSFKTLLDDNEINSADRFHFKKDHDRYVISHGALRIILARYLNVEPQSIVYEKASHGKPFLKDHPEFKYNLTHSGQMVLCAINLEKELGVDVEYLDKKVEYIELADRFFESNESAFIARQQGDALKHAFFKTWTQKEAFIKAIGLGLSFPLKNFRVEAAPDLPGDLIAVNDDVLRVSDWRLESFQVADDYFGAVAVDVSVELISFFDFSCTKL